MSIEELTFISLIKYPFISMKFNCLTEIEYFEEILKWRERNLEQIVFKYWGILKDYFLTLNR